MEVLQLAPWQFELGCWQFAVDSLLNEVGMNAVAPSKNIAVIVFSLRTLYVKKLLNPVKKVFYTTVFFSFRLNWER
ncbi:hypothetical protein GTQ43_35270 [Nostoc sp. KVJ3]|uniref:hypothetical protein n=1 Tax=Nostoc sp. KVJ3 TaxID=457945 RepID=UPI002238B039|nr:hypothetical protein [Nostoc sp. KVJ3]MCW5318537.1 hypothetical protein [Nostoc sp. KVJ3]MCW5318748.1 hypothetical protein [Nostoc sp. KVJ3]